MKKDKRHLLPLIIGLGWAITSIQQADGQSANDLPNILWITSEDNSPFLGCYGDSLAVTPNLDGLASDGFRYTHAYANAPVCAPARNTIITGVYASSNGHQHMRSGYLCSDTVRLFPVYLKELGYYCTNCSKKDYNLKKPLDPKEEPWDESSSKAHYRNRKPGQAFFHIKNIGTSHESSIHRRVPAEDLSHDPAAMKLPPYHPDTVDIRHDWAQYYDKITAMDEEVGRVLKQLEEDGLADDTIVFYYGDHGGVLARSKRYVYESGTHVPFIVRVPEKFKHLYPAEAPGDPVSRLISFVDLAPTMLSIVGTPIPDYMQGSAFLGKQKTEDPETASSGRPENLDILEAYLKDDDGAVRYWGATGLLILGDEANGAKRALTDALDDEYPNVVVVAAEALYQLGEKEVATKALLRIIEHPEEMARCHALNAVQVIGEKGPVMQQAVVDLVLGGKRGSRRYDERAANYLLDLWEVDMEVLWKQKGK